jgi:hypothetical protein
MYHATAVDDFRKNVLTPFFVDYGKSVGKPVDAVSLLARSTFLPLPVWLGPAELVHAPAAPACPPVCSPAPSLTRPPPLTPPPRRPSSTMPSSPCRPSS